jgi:hypothetical protein
MHSDVIDQEINHFISSFRLYRPFTEISMSVAVCLSDQPYLHPLLRKRIYFLCIFEKFTVEIGVHI